MALCILAAHFLALLILRPDGLNVGLVLLRYMIVIIPIALLMVAVAVERLVSILERKVPAMPMSVATLPFSAFALAVLLFLAGPLPQTYSAPNDFTNHTAFQGSYERLGCENSDSRTVFTDFKVRKNEISSFYHRLKDQKDVQVILEYPFDVCNHNNLHYFYQHFHGKRVIAGYNRRMDQLGWILQPDESPSPQKQMIVSECSLDRILFRAEDPGLLAFQNLIDINDSKALAESGAEILVLRKSLMALCVMDGREASIRVYYRCMAAQKKGFTEIFGDPVYEDAEIVCFRIRSRF